jgi:hypothetical protein
MQAWRRTMSTVFSANPVVLFVSVPQAPGRSKLKEVEKEFDILLKIFARRKDICDFEALPDCSLDQMVDTFQLYEDRVAIVHFAGHADGLSLCFSDGNINQSLHRYLGNRYSVRLVVLNGCCTEEHVQRLLDEGISGVIATSDRIGDTNARKFAETFYDHLLEGKPIQNAFESAVALLNSDERNFVENAPFRDVIETNRTSAPLNAYPLQFYPNPKAYYLEDFRIESKLRRSVALSINPETSPVKHGESRVTIQAAFDILVATSDVPEHRCKTAKVGSIVKGGEWLGPGKHQEPPNGMHISPLIENRGSWEYRLLSHSEEGFVGRFQASRLADRSNGEISVELFAIPNYVPAVLLVPEVTAQLMLLHTYLAKHGGFEFIKRHQVSA